MAVKWAVQEPLSSQALTLLQAEHELMAPDIFRVEVTNAILKKVRRRELAASDARVAIETIPAYMFLTPTEDVFDVALDLSLESGCTFYDALYAALAVQEGCTLITGDNRLIRTLGPGFHQSILWLGDLPAT